MYGNYVIPHTYCEHGGLGGFGKTTILSRMQTTRPRSWLKIHEQKENVQDNLFFNCAKSLWKETLSQGFLGGNQTPEAEHYRYTINVERIDGKFPCQVSVLDQPKICTSLPRVRDKHLLAELENHGIVLTDIGEKTPPIRLLLGSDVLGRILSGIIEVLKSSITAIETSLGWSVMGSEKKTTVVNMVTLWVLVR
ncbi:hypothetical protein AVEN_66489-1 [Araneus ventricosus]|uniref:Peptidase aspartic putative domain-containing protein n=1 Tax=Araneus ventricosus TaxID=182803 RepID=A0A4Y2LEV2_ARAVE|nr:hypothetical protein AVEN_66489-1 [Araneus ventricosus]